MSNNSGNFGRETGLKTGDVLGTPAPLSYQDILRNPLPAHSALYFQDQDTKRKWETTAGQHIDIHQAERLLFTNLPSIPIGVFRMYEDQLGLMVTCIHDPDFDEESYLRSSFHDAANPDIVAHHTRGLSFTTGQSPYNTDFHYTIGFQTQSCVMPTHVGSVLLEGMDTRPSLQRKGTATNALRSLFSYFDATHWQSSYLKADSPASAKTWMKLGFMPFPRELVLYQRWAGGVLSHFDQTLETEQKQSLRNFIQNPDRKNLFAILADEALADSLVDGYIYEEEDEGQLPLFFNLANREHRSHLAQYQPASLDQS